MFGDGNRAAEMDPVIELYGPGSGLVASADATLVGEPETIAANVAPGRNLLKVANYPASASPADYGLRVVLGPAGGAPGPQAAGPWLANAAPLPHAQSVATAARPSITFGRDLLGSSVTNGTVLLLDGRTGAVVSASVARSGRTVTLTPARALTPGVPYQVFIAGVRDTAGAFAPAMTVPFTAAAAAPPTYPVGGTYSPFSGDFDGNGYDDILWYAPGAAADYMWRFDGDGRVSVPISAGGTYVTAAGDFDGNGYDDILWHRPGTASDSIWYSGPSGLTSRTTVANGSYVPIAADFDRNGYDDIFWYGRGTIADWVWYFGPSGPTSRAMTVNGFYRPLTGDFNRDGYGDVFWYAPGTGVESTWYGASTGFRQGPAPSASGTYTTLPLDANGDGYADVFWYSTAASWFWRNGPTGFTSVALAPMPAGMRPVTGEFSGDGRDDVLAYLPGAAVDRLRPGTPNGIG